MTSRGRARLLVVAELVIATALLLLAPSPARAEATTHEELFHEGTEALKDGRYERAIVVFETLADRGFTHPDASFNRGLAYVTRIREGADEQGDLGRAAAAFEETLALRPGDDAAEKAVDLVRAEVTRRRSRTTSKEVDVRPTLDRLVVNLASERTWGIAAVAASLILAVGLVLRRRPTGPVHVAGSVLAPSALVALLVLVPLTLGARYLRLEKRTGVVVATEVHLTDVEGQVLDTDPVPEAARVEVGDQKGHLLQVRWGGTEGWAPMGTVRILQDGR